MNAKNSPVKPGAKSKPRIEFAGKITVSNFWVKIGFSREELGALCQIAKSFEVKHHQTPGRAAAFVLTTALMHWEKLEPLVFDDQHYAKAEGFSDLGSQELFQTKTIARKFDLAGAKAI